MAKENEERKRLETKPAWPYHIYYMIRSDIPSVLQIERESFECPWTEEDFLRFLRMRDCVGIKVEKNHKIVGFMIYQLYKHKFHILNLAVSPSHRRCKIGACIVSDLIRKLSNSLRAYIDLEVRETNVVAQRFFHSQGFKAVKVLRGFYEDSGEDAYLMKYHSR